MAFYGINNIAVVTLFVLVGVACSSPSPAPPQQGAQAAVETEKKERPPIAEGSEADDTSGRDREEEQKTPMELHEEQMLREIYGDDVDIEVIRQMERREALMDESFPREMERPTEDRDGRSQPAPPQSPPPSSPPPEPSPPEPEVPDERPEVDLSCETSRDCVVVNRSPDCCSNCHGAVYNRESLEKLDAWCQASTEEWSAQCPPGGLACKMTTPPVACVDGQCEAIHRRRPRR